MSALQLVLTDKVGADRYKLWFGANTRFVVGIDTLVVQVPSPFYQEWLRNNFRRELEAAGEEVLGRVVSVTFQVAPSVNPQRDEATPPSSPATAAGLTLLPADASPPQSSLVAAAAPVRRRFSRFDAWIEGAGNLLATRAARNVVEQPGSISPLVIHGPTGVGKTHLLESIWSGLRRQGPGRVYLYFTAEQFTTHFLGALHGSGLPSFRRKCRSADVLLIDDVQFLIGKRATIAELQHTVDALQAAGKQVVFALDRAPAELRELPAELQARLQGGLVCGIEPADLPTRVGIVQRLAADMQLTLDDAAVRAIAARITTHARALAGALKRLHAATWCDGGSIDRALVERVLGEVASTPIKGVRLGDVEQAICHTLGLEPHALQPASGSRAMQPARMLAMWLARKHTRAAYSEIGRYFGLRSHSTVVAAQRRVERWLEQQATIDVPGGQADTQELVRRVERMLAS